MVIKVDAAEVSTGTLPSPDVAIRYPSIGEIAILEDVAPMPISDVELPGAISFRLSWLRTDQTGMDIDLFERAILGLDVLEEKVRSTFAE